MPSILSLLVANFTTWSEPELPDVENIPPSSRFKSQLELSLVPELVIYGWKKESVKRYEKQEDWVRFHEVLKSKVQNIVTVSGLVLGANTNFLVSGDLRLSVITYAAVAASMFTGLLSIIFGCFFLWSLAHPARLKVLVRHRSFYILYGTASLFGSGSALIFFIAVGSWTWQNEAAAGHGWGGKISSIGLGFVLVISAGVCFFLGAFTVEERRDGNPLTSRDLSRDGNTH